MFEDLAGWSLDNQRAALQPFGRSCQQLFPNPHDTLFRNEKFGKIKAWRVVCQRLKQHKLKISNNARWFFESMFTPYLVTRAKSGAVDGIFTGYYQPEIAGALYRYGPFQTPIYQRPNDLNGSTKPYLSREQILREGLEGRAKPIAWIASPVDAFFLQIQGSGRIRLPTKDIIHVGFAGHNRHPYTSIGRVLINLGILKREEVSMQSIRKWLSGSSRRAMDIMNKNKRYVFFKRQRRAGPIGAQGVVLTPGRSLAIDSRFIGYGIPVWLDTKDPILIQKSYQRLLISQDTGGAIKGIIRGDIFFGHGVLAAQRAGKMNRLGKYYVLIPKTAKPSL